MPALAAVLLLAAGAAAQSDRLALVHDTIEGTLLAVSAEGVAFLQRDAEAAALHPWAALAPAGPMSSRVVTVRLVNGDRITGRVAPGPDGVRVQSEYLPEIEVRPAHLMPARFRSAPDIEEDLEDLVLDAVQEEERKTILDPKDWTGRIALLGTFRQGNVDSSLFQLTASARRQWGEDRFNAEAGFAYGDTEGQATARNAYGRAKWDHFYDDDFYSYALSEAYWDEIQNLDLRAILGIGAGLNLWKGAGDHRSLDLEAGISGIYEDFRNRPSDIQFALRFAASYLDMWTEDLAFTQRIEILMPVDDPGDYILRSHTALDMSLSERWTLKNILELQYLGDPPADTRAFDLRLLAGIEYKF